MALNLSSLFGGGMILKQQLITANGDWVRPERMAGNTVYVTMSGGGSSGVGGSPVIGGMGGQYVIRIPVDIGALPSVPCVIGQGGAQVGSASGAHNPGGPTSFSNLLSVLGGNALTGQGGANGGSNVTGSIVSGQSTPLGSGGIVVTTNTNRAGSGGGLVLDASGVQGSALPGQIISAKGYGAGGCATGAGYAGAPGAILIEWPEFI